MHASYFKHSLKFLIPSGTSRGVLSEKESWFIIIKEENKIGIGECSIIKGLSPDPFFEIEKNLDFICQNIQLGFKELSKTIESFPSIIFGLVGLYVFSRTLGFGSSLLTGSLTLPIMTLPMVVVTTEEALQAVPKGFREASLAVGATKWQTVRYHVVCLLYTSDAADE